MKTTSNRLPPRLPLSKKMLPPRISRICVSIMSYACEYVGFDHSIDVKSVIYDNSTRVSHLARHVLPLETVAVPQDATALLDPDEAELQEAALLHIKHRIVCG